MLNPHYIRARPASCAALPHECVDRKAMIMLFFILRRNTGVLYTERTYRLRMSPLDSYLPLTHVSPRLISCETCSAYLFCFCDEGGSAVQRSIDMRFGRRSFCNASAPDASLGGSGADATADYARRSSVIRVVSRRSRVAVQTRMGVDHAPPRSFKPPFLQSTMFQYAFFSHM